MILKNNFDVIEAVIGGTCLALFKVFLIVFTNDFEQAKRVRKE